MSEINAITKSCKVQSGGTVVFEMDGRHIKRMVAELYDWDAFIVFCNTGKYPQ